MASRNLLLKGMRWRVGSGMEISTWPDPWLPTSYPFRPSSNSLIGQSVSMVSNFILPSRSWDRSKIEETFEESDAATILAIPLSDRFTLDRRVWAPDTKGSFTIKSAYQLAMDSQDLVSDFLSSDQCISLWKKVWHAHIPASAKVCVWKAGTNILPTADRLLLKQVPMVNSMCCLCNSALENILHLCGFCPFLREVFNAIPYVALCYPAADYILLDSWTGFCTTPLCFQRLVLTIFFS